MVPTTTADRETATARSSELTISSSVLGVATISRKSVKPEVPTRTNR
jgi:hypothetical protein